MERQEHKEFLKISQQKDVFIKTVISGQTKKEDVLHAVKLVSSIDPDILFILQPNYFEMRNGVIAQCLEYQKDCLKYLSNVRIIPQVHKFMKLR